MSSNILCALIGPRFEVRISLPRPEEKINGASVTWWTVELRYAATGELVAGGTGETFAEACAEAYEDLSTRWVEARMAVAS